MVKRGDCAVTTRYFNSDFQCARASDRVRLCERPRHTMPPLDGFARAQLRMASALARDDSPNKRAPKLAAWAGGAAPSSAARNDETKSNSNSIPDEAAVANAVRRDASASASASRSPTKMRPNVRFLGNALRAIASSNARLERETREAAAASASASVALRAGDERRETVVDAPKYTKRGGGGDDEGDGDDDVDGRWVKNRRGRGKKGGGKRRKRDADDDRRERKRPARESREEGEWSDGD